MDEKVEIEIAGRRLQVCIEGLAPIEIAVIANMVNEQLWEAQRRNPDMADTGKLAIHALIYMAAELYKLRQAGPQGHRPDAVNRNLDGTPRLPRLDPKVPESYKPHINALINLANDLDKMMRQADVEGREVL
jgi:cell division protein ZapA (FtsZ GTPase activity inhibitor)